MFNNRLLTLAGIVIIISIAIHGQESNMCNKCMANGAACKNSTNYEICFNGVLSGTTGTCENSLCSDAKEICVKSPHPTANFVCGSGSSSGGQCGSCGTNDVYTCVDTTHFTLCANKQLYISCPSGESCSNDYYRQTNNSLCAPSTILQYFKTEVTCTDAGTTPAPSTPSPSQSKTKCENANKPNTKFYISADDNNRTYYLYCEKVNNEWYAILYKCEGNLQFSDANEKCE